MVEGIVWCRRRLLCGNVVSTAAASISYLCCWLRCFSGALLESSEDHMKGTTWLEWLVSSVVFMIVVLILAHVVSKYVVQ